MDSFVQCEVNRDKLDTILNVHNIWPHQCWCGQLCRVKLYHRHHAKVLWHFGGSGGTSRMESIYKPWEQWRSQGLPGWASRPPGGPKWGRKWVKVWGKIRKLNRDLRKKWGKWNSCPPRTVRLATDLPESWVRESTYVKYPDTKGLDLGLMTWGCVLSGKTGMSQSVSVQLVL